MGRRSAALAAPDTTSAVTSGAKAECILHWMCPPRTKPGAYFRVAGTNVPQSDMFAIILARHTFDAATANDQNIGRVQVALTTLPGSEIHRDGGNEDLLRAGLHTPRVGALHDLGNGRLAVRRCREHHELNLKPMWDIVRQV